MTPQEQGALARRRLAEAHTRRRGDLARILLLQAPERPAEHVRNALAILRYSLDHDEPLIGNGCPAVAVPITSLARIQARLEAAIEQLENRAPSCPWPRTLGSDLEEDR